MVSDKLLLWVCVWGGGGGFLMINGIKMYTILGINIPIGTGRSRMNAASDHDLYCLPLIQQLYIYSQANGLAEEKYKVE